MWTIICNLSHISKKAKLTCEECLSTINSCLQFPALLLVKWLNILANQFLPRVSDVHPLSDVAIKASLFSMPKSCRSLCCMQKVYLLKLSKQLLTKLFNAGTQLMAQNSVNQHIIIGLYKTINMKRKKYKKRTRLNLLGENLSNT